MFLVYLAVAETSEAVKGNAVLSFDAERMHMGYEIAYQLIMGTFVLGDIYDRWMSTVADTGHVLPRLYAIADIVHSLPRLPIDMQDINGSDSGLN